MYPDANQNTALCSRRICKEWSANLEHICNSVFFPGLCEKVSEEQIRGIYPHETPDLVFVPVEMCDQAGVEFELKLGGGCVPSWLTHHHFLSRD